MPIILTVVVICKDNPEELKRTLLSIYSCDLEADRHNELEVLVIDSSGDIKCKNVWMGLAGDWPNARYEWTPPRGIYAAKKVGLLSAQGMFVQFLNSGDIYASESAIADCLRAVTGSPNDCRLIYFDTYELHPDDELRLCPTRNPQDIVKQSLESLQHPYWNDFPRTASCLFRRSALTIEIGGLHIAEDHRFILSLIAASNGEDCLHIPSCLSVYEIGGYSWQSPIEVAFEWCCIQKMFYRGSPKDLHVLFIDFLMGSLRGFIDDQNIV
ncbi:hypothetical protein [Synechococcus sp. GFB01]|uniref:hypothetical protein n=1 Tax=Synechococcus sp. GFB01 TaxID=1662190 RepID=UPI000A6E7D07|nr:hypothetical protein [Synechococcus sp. GFB01]